jgi:Fe-S-cluster-containing dehydrogenase component/DMSO reductase anchor subunit
LATVEQPEITRTVDAEDLLQQFLDLHQQGYAPSAVEQFSHWHEESVQESADNYLAIVDLDQGDSRQPYEPAQAKHYRDLIPVGMPGKEEQFAFEVDLAACSGCKSCVAACHSLNGLEDEELWREVGMLQSESPRNETQTSDSLTQTSSSLAVIQHVTTACHHCVDPGCLKGCPVKAYEKDPLTGIVRHLDDQCIGCQYCTLMCPYEVPKYSEKLGIVRKCDMCHQRLSVGQAPACVQACPNEAIRITVVSHEEILNRAAAQTFLPDAPPTSITAPSTVYKNQKHLAATAARADYANDKPQHSHFPLALMLVITQLSVGMFIIERLLATFAGFSGDGGLFADSANSLLQNILRMVAFMVTIVGIHIGPLHLGRPMFAFRAFLNFKTSWLSREIIVFGKHMGAASLFVTASVVVWLEIVQIPEIIVTVLGWLTVVTGIAGVSCSAMVYVATKRPYWSLSRTLTKFFLTSAALGSTAVAMFLIGWNLFAENQQVSNLLLSILVASALVSVVLKLLSDLAFFSHLKDSERTMLKRTALLMRGQLRSTTLVRFALSGMALCLIPIAYFTCSVSSPSGMVALPALCFTLLLLGEILERRLFFTSVIPFRMPGIQH